MSQEENLMKQNIEQLDKEKEEVNQEAENKNNGSDQKQRKRKSFVTQRKETLRKK